VFATESTDVVDTKIDWSRARCRSGDVPLTALFFSEQIADIAKAKTICQECELLDLCLATAIDRREPWGVWGGQLFANGKILAQKRKRGRPPKIRPEEVAQVSA
jgi:WhiB family transcriptional regulator, redox-sensing transcriptional regulator